MSDMSMGGALQPAAGMGREAVRVSYLTSSQYRGKVLHFFQTAETGAMRIDNVHRQKRIFALVEVGEFGADLHGGVARCVGVSKIEEITLTPSEMKTLLGPFTEFDVICQGSSMLDFIRTIGALYCPSVAGNQMTLLEIDPSAPSAHRHTTVQCRVFHHPPPNPAAAVSEPPGSPPRPQPVHQIQYHNHHNQGHNRY
eukprot:Hpha_TRINITY_DN30607_c0_g1::TRINITY_DN30607_c0_g1_i1::g.18268::m.18268